MVVVSALGRAALCPFIARDIHSLLLFPEAFLMLVLSKVYLVTKGALVPEMAALEMVDLGAQPGMVGPAWVDDGGTRFDDPGESGFDDASGRAPFRTPPYGNPADRARGRPGDRRGRDRARSGHAERPHGAPRLPVRLRVRAAGRRHPQVGRRPGRPVVVHGGVRGGRRGRDPAAGPSRPPGRPSGEGRHGHDDRRGPGRPGPDAEEWWLEEQRDLAAFRPIAGTQVILALTPMSVLKLLLGFLTFLFAFGLRREGAATWWFGLLIGALTAGAVIGVLLVGRIRRVLSEQQMLTASLWLVAAAGLLGWLFPHQGLQALVALSVGAAGAVAKPSFDALVQRHVRESDQGRAFAASRPGSS